MDVLVNVVEMVVSLLAMTVAVLVVPFVFMVIFGLLSGFSTNRGRSSEHD